MINQTRRTALATTLGAAASLACRRPALATGTVRVGYQKYGNLLLLKTSGLLEDRLKPLGRTVEWREFGAGPALMEALAAGAIDFGTAGETPPIFAQAAGAPFLYLGAEPPAPVGEAILVLDHSPIRTLADLRGKTIAFNKGSNVHYLFVRAIAEAGLGLADVTPVYIAPPDGRAAFERGSVDAWAIWDPFMAAAQAVGNTRVLTDGHGLAANNQFYFRAKAFTDAAVIDALFQSIAAIDARTVGDPSAAAATLSPAMGLPAPVLAGALARQGWAVRRMDAGLVAEQQVIADTFFKLGLIPKAIRVADVAAVG